MTIATVAGADWSGPGWVVVRARREGDALVSHPDWVEVLATFEHVLESVGDLLAVDVPIGLLDEYQEGGRECDFLARAVLGWPRGTSVFSAPARSVFGARTFDQAKGRARLSLQSFSILPLIVEVDAALTPALQSRVYEVHPEVSFRFLAGHPAAYSKSTPEGRQERTQNLRRFAPGVAGALARKPRRCGWDDLIDACLAVWTADRIKRGVALRIPATPSLDARGLRMEIWA